MRFSILTPSHDPRWLGDCFSSLQAQTYTDFEWIVLLNRGADWGPCGDSRVKIIHAEDMRPMPGCGIGSLKLTCANLAQGDTLVELDHDDMLVPNALEKLDDASRGRTTPAFYYSDFASFFPNQDSEIFSSTYGWEHYTVQHGKQVYTAHAAFEATPRSLCEISYAPNHVRAWDREAYKLSGGHNPVLPIGDDHDLICRTYLVGVPFVHVPSCLYLYRRIIDPKTANSYLQHSQVLQATARSTYENMLERLVLEWSRRCGLWSLDLSGGSRPDGYRTIDVADADLVMDFTQTPWTAIGDNSVGVIRIVDNLGRVPRERFVAFMNEVYRVLAPGGWLFTWTPSTEGRGAWQNPEHVNYINENTFWYFTNREYAKHCRDARCRFQAVRLRTSSPSLWHKERHIAYVRADLCALKGQRQPGRCLI